MTQTDLTERIKETASKLEAAKQRAASGVLDGDNDIESAEIASLEVELETLRSAEEMAIIRTREEAHAAVARKRQVLQKEGRDLVKERTAALQTAEEALREFVEQVDIACNTNARLAAAFHTLTGKRPPSSVSGIEFPRRLSDRAATILASMKSRDGLERFGALRWHCPPSLFQSRQSWAAEEMKLINESLDQILSPE